MSDITKEDIAATKPDAAAGAGIVAKAENAAIAKTKLKNSSAFTLGIMAGIMIALGAIFMTYVKTDHELSFAVSAVFSACMFSIGLVCVVVAGAELFTGNALMIVAASNKKITWGAMLKNWGIVYVGNFIGSLIIVAVVAGCGIWAVKAGDNTVGAQMVAIASAKTSLPAFQIFCRGIMCNLLVCLAVWMGFAGRTVIDKIFTCIFPVTAFVAMGYEHCVANMFLLPMGYAASLAGYGDAVITIGGILYNILFASLGNIVGGCVLVGLIYWFAYKK